MSIEKLDFNRAKNEHKSYSTFLNQVIQNIKDPLVLGIYIYLSSLPPDWSVNRQHLMNHFNVGRDRVKRALGWLNEHYLIRYEQERAPNGQLGDHVLIVMDGFKFVDKILNATGGLKISPAVTGGLDYRWTEKPVDGETAPTYTIINTYTTLEEHKEKVSVDNFALPDWLNPEDWEAFKQHRIDMKAKLTPKAEKLALQKLCKLRDQGYDLTQVINESILAGWKGLFPLKLDINRTGIPKTASQQRMANYIQMQRDAFEKLGDGNGFNPFLVN